MRGIGSRKTGDSQHVYSESNLGPVQEQYKLLTSESSPQYQLPDFIDHF